MIKANLLILQLLSIIMLLVTPAEAAIYGNDDRINPYEHNSKILQQISKTVVLLSSLTTVPVDKGFCSGALFRHRRQIYLITAHHCMVKPTDCRETQIVRNFEIGSDEDQIGYSCKRLLHSSEKSGIAIASLSILGDKDNVPALPMSFSNPAVGDSLAVIGHPEGLEKKIADNCFVVKYRDNGKFRHGCDTFRGNSGSPTINVKDGSIAGIFVTGRADRDSDGNLLIHQEEGENSLPLAPIQDSILHLLDEIGSDE